MSYLHVNSVRKKLDNLPEIIKQKVDVLATAEAKKDAPFPSAEFFLEGYHIPYRISDSHKDGGLLVYVKETITSCQLSLPKFQC